MFNFDESITAAKRFGDNANSNLKIIRDRNKLGKRYHQQEKSRNNASLFSKTPASAFELRLYCKINIGCNS